MSIKRILSLVLAITIIFTAVCYADTTSSSYSEENGMYIQSVTIPAEVNIHAQKEFLNLIHPAKDRPEEYGFKKSEVEKLYLGNRFSMYTYDENGKITTDIYYFLVMSDNKIKGTLAIGCNEDGTYSGTFSTELANKLESILKKSTKNTPIILVAYDTAIIAIRENKSYIVDAGLKGSIDNAVLDGLKMNSSDFIKKFNTDFENLRVEQNKENVTNVIAPAPVSDMLPEEDSVIINSYPYNNYLSVPLVAQGNNPWCWAASIASITGYMDNTARTAAQVVAAIGGDENSQGTSTNINDGYAAYGYSSYWYAPFTMSAVIDCIEDDRPLQMLALASDDSGHSVVIRGYSTSSSAASLSIMEPGSATYKTVSFNGEPEDVYFIYNSKMFYWTYTVYPS